MLASAIAPALALPSPAAHSPLEILRIVAFIAHIAFVNLITGGAILVLGFEIRGLTNRDYDRLARAFARSITVNKAFTLALGAAPLLLLGVLHLDDESVLSARAWSFVAPTGALALLLFHLHARSWDRLADQKRLHIAIQALGVSALLLVPLVFLGSVLLTTYPERWSPTLGFLSALSVPELLPRYFHFICASLTVTSLFGVGWFGRERFPVEQIFDALDRARLRRELYVIALTTSLAQFVVGTAVLAAVPTTTLHWTALSAILLGVAMAIPAVWLMWKEATSKDATRGRFPIIVAQLALTVVCMASGRHMIRGIALAQHRRAIDEDAERKPERPLVSFPVSVGETKLGPLAAGLGTHGNRSEQR